MRRKHARSMETDWGIRGDAIVGSSKFEGHENPLWFIGSFYSLSFILLWVVIPLLLAPHPSLSFQANISTTFLEYLVLELGLFILELGLGRSKGLAGARVGNSRGLGVWAQEAPPRQRALLTAYRKYWLEVPLGG